VVAGECPAGAGQSRLDFVGDHQHVTLGADRAHRGQIFLRRDDDSGLTLDRFEQHCDGVLVDGSRHGVGITERHRTKAGRERAETVAGGLIRREPDDADGPTVEVVVGDYDVRLPGRHAFDVGAPLAGHLDAALDCLGAAVHRQHHVFAAQRGKGSAEASQCLGVKRPADECDQIQLCVGGGDDFRVAMSEVHRRVRRQTIQVTPTLDVGDPHALGMRGHHRQRRVVVREVALVKGDRRERRSTRFGVDSVGDRHE
jgi:hypothetical protein